MKFKKLSLLVLALTAYVGAFALPNPENPTTETSFKTTDFKPWGFEFKNKDKNPVQIQLVENDNNLLDPSLRQTFVAGSQGTKEEQHGYLRINKTLVDPSKSYLLYIFDGNADLNTIQNIDAKQAYMIAANPLRKVIAVTYENNQIRPQTGKLGGSSQSGLNLYRNIKDNEIKIQFGAKIKK